MARKHTLPLTGTLLLAFLWQIQPVGALTRRVPAQYPSIQQAISASASGDTVLVSSGTYLEHLDFLGRDLVVRSQGGPAVTIVNAEGLGASVARLANCGEGASLEGFTLRGGIGTGGGAYRHGGGVLLTDTRDSGPTIQNNWILYNSALSGGGISVVGAARVIQNRIAFNTAVMVGGGVYSEVPGALSVSITDNEIVGNRVLQDGPLRQGGGIMAVGTGPGVIRRNLVACNEAYEDGGMYIGTTGGLVEGNTVFGNWGRQGVGGVHFNNARTPLDVNANAIVYNFGGGVLCLGTSALIAQCNDIHGNNPDFIGVDCVELFTENGNFSADPLFGQSSGCPPAEGDLCLSPDSPLLPEHSPPGCGLIGARGLCSPDAVGDVAGNLAGILRAFSARPNPFFERTTITFYLPQPSEVEISIYGVLGRKVRTLLAGALRAGENELEWDGRGDDGEAAASGAYVAVIRSGGREVTRTLLLVR